MSRDVEVVISYLELMAPVPSLGDSRPDGSFRPWPAGIELRHERAPEVASVARSMYLSVGAAYHWLDRADWTEEQWRAEVDHEGVELWTARIGEEIVGYFLLHVERDSVELKYFGLTPRFVGRGIGGPLLSAAIQRARSIGPGRVTLNTCSLDHPAALPNYLARGFRVVRSAVERRTLPS
jgi:GNAT superfamily N-acetyltransferase